MDFAQIQWATALPALVGGGLMGALFRMAYEKIRDRKQPIGLRTEALAIFSKNINSSGLNFTFGVSDKPAKTGTTQVVTELDNLHVATIELLNKGNRDLTDFQFSIELLAGLSAVHCSIDAPSLLHETRFENPTPWRVSSHVVFLLKTFNRADRYQVSMYVTADRADMEVDGSLNIHCAMPIKFVPMPTYTETFEAVSGALGAGPAEFALSLLLPSATARTQASKHGRGS